MSPTVEMRRYLTTFSKRCEKNAWWRPMAHVDVLTDIQADAEAEVDAKAAGISSAEQELRALAKGLPARAARRALKIAEALHDLACTALLIVAFLILAAGYACTLGAAIRGDNELRTARPARTNPRPTTLRRDQNPTA